MLTLAIGPLRYTLEGLPLGLELRVRNRYAPFLVDGDDDAMLVRFSVVDGGPHRPEITPTVERTGPRRYAISYGAVEADVDLEAGCVAATVLSTPYLVDSVLRMVTTLRALDEDALLLHGSGVWLRGRAGGEVLVCFGPSGVGKTTVARSVAPHDVLCDEMMLLQALPDGRVLAHGTPFHGDLGITAPGTGSARALVRLHHADERSRLVDVPQALSAAASARALLSCVLFFSRDEALAERLLDLALRIGASRTYTLHFTRQTHVPSLLRGHDVSAAADVGAEVIA